MTPRIAFARRVIRALPRSTANSLAIDWGEDTYAVKQWDREELDRALDAYLSDEAFIEQLADTVREILLVMLERRR